MQDDKLTRAYFGVIAGLLVITGIAKLYTATGNDRVLSTEDVLLPITVRQILIVSGVIELCIAGYCIRATRPRIKHALVLWLSVVLLVYRLARWLVNPGAPCMCIGKAAESLPIRREHMDAATKAALAVMLFGSLYFLGREMANRAVNRMGIVYWRRLRIAMTAVFATALLPALQSGCVALVRPPITGPIVLRSAEAKLSRTFRSSVRFMWANWDEVAPAFFLAVLAAEDIRFFDHSGFDWEEIRNVIAIAPRGRPLRGASTITQQCARSLFLWQGRSWIRKGLEAYYTVWMELLLSKRRILELYVNVIELGDGIYGIEAAAQHYYSKSARDLTREEAAMLAAILPAPKRWNPLQPNERVQRRQQIILSQMDQVRLPWESSAETAQTRASTNTVNMAEPQPAQTHENGPPTDVPTATAP